MHFYLVINSRCIDLCKEIIFMRSVIVSSELAHADAVRRPEHEAGTPRDRLVWWVKHHHHHSPRTAGYLWTFSWHRGAAAKLKVYRSRATAGVANCGACFLFRTGQVIGANMFLGTLSTILHCPRAAVKSFLHRATPSTAESLCQASRAGNHQRPWPCG